jgi:hypothetical protein
VKSAHQIRTELRSLGILNASIAFACFAASIIAWVLFYFLSLSILYSLSKIASLILSALGITASISSNTLRFLALVVLLILIPMSRLKILAPGIQLSKFLLTPQNHVQFGLLRFIIFAPVYLTGIALLEFRYAFCCMSMNAEQAAEILNLLAEKERPIHSLPHPKTVKKLLALLWIQHTDQSLTEVELLFR